MASDYHIGLQGPEEVLLGANQGPMLEQLSIRNVACPVGCVGCHGDGEGDKTQRIHKLYEHSSCGAPFITGHGLALLESSVRVPIKSFRILSLLAYFGYSSFEYFVW